MDICTRTYEEWLEEVRCFHSYPAPGVVIGGFMVDLAYRHLPEAGLFDAIVETDKCLPDAVQLLTPCTIGNGWLRIINTGRYALSLYDKTSGLGVRVFLDAAKLEPWSEIKSWFFSLKPKKEQDDALLLRQIKDAGDSLLGIRRVKIILDSLPDRHENKYTVCTECGESFLYTGGKSCRICESEIHFFDYVKG